MKARAWIGLAGVLAAEAALLWLGTWQLDRRAWKTALIAGIDAGLAAPEAPYADDLPEFRPVTLAGTLDLDHAVLLQGRPHLGQAGTDLLAPLLRDGTAPVLIDLGWLPDPAPPLEHGQRGVEVHGITRRPPPPSWILPRNDPAQGRWWRIDLGELAAAAGVPAYAPLWVMARTPLVPGVEPQQAAPELRNEHLNYAIFWYIMAAMLPVMTILAVRRQKGS